MQDFRELAKALRKDSDNRVSNSDPYVASVLRAAGPGGVHVTLIERLLSDLGYADAASLAAELLSGFAIVGEVNVQPEATDCLVRDFEVTTQHVDFVAEELAGRFVRMQSAPAKDELDADVRNIYFAKQSKINVNQLGSGHFERLR